jgi:PHD/YefM family antitoxin component YafN of YafNO toxin-antitoxin module
MVKTVSITKLRVKLTETIESLDTENAVMVVRHRKPAAYLVSPRIFDELIEQLEKLEDLQDMALALTDYHKGAAVEAEDVFGQLGL